MDPSVVLCLFSSTSLINACTLVHLSAIELNDHGHVFAFHFCI